MRVLLINRYSHIDGGADRVFQNTLELLLPLSPDREERGPGGEAGEERRKIKGEWRKSGGEVEVDAFTGINAEISPINPRQLSLFGKIRMVRNYLYNKQVAKALDRKIREYRPDVAHLHLFYGTLSSSVLRTLRKHRIPVVHTVHDYRLICPANAMLDRHGNVCEQCQGRHFHKSILRRCSEGNLFYSTVIALDAWIRKYLIRPQKLVDRFLFVSEFSMKKHIGFDSRYKGKSSLLYNTTPIPDDNPPVIRGDYFLYFGRLSKEKGLLTLVAAAKEAGVYVKFAGTGPQEQELRLASPPGPLSPGREERGGGGEVLGFKSGEELAEVIRGASFIILPSEWYENNPMSIVEAFALGKPVIGARIGGIPELVSEDTGLLFEPGDSGDLAKALKKAAEMPDEKYLEISKKCITFAQNHFSRENHLQHLIETYREAIDEYKAD